MSVETAQLTIAVGREAEFCIRVVR